MPMLTFKEVSHFRGICDQWKHYVILKGAQLRVYVGHLDQLNYLLLLLRSPHLHSVICFLVYGIGSLFLLFSLILFQLMFQEFDLFF